MDVQHVAVDVTYITYVDVQQFLYGPTACRRGRPPVTIRTYNITSIYVHQFLYGRTTTGRGRPTVNIWACNIT